jgi:hypothetical protein
LGFFILINTNKLANQIAVFKDSSPHQTRQSHQNLPPAFRGNDNLNQDLLFIFFSNNALISPNSLSAAA